MLPLLQTHRQTVSTASLDHMPSPVDGPPVRDDQLQREVSPYQRQTFPIRTFHPHPRYPGHRSYGVHAPHSVREHQLRRKTPNGTIDAGYDGSSAKSSNGEPPLKQLALPGQTTNAFGYQMLDARSYHQNLMVDGSNAMAQLPPAPWQPSAYAVGSIEAQIFQPSSQHAAIPFASVYQPVIRANEYNVRAFCPPPPTLVGGLPLGQLYWQQGASPWDYQSTQDASAMSRGAYPVVPRPEYTPNLMTPHLLPASNHLFGYASQNSKPQIQNTYTSNYEGYKNQLDFKDKTLSQAYRCYASLVGFIQANARANINKDSNGADHASPKHMIFPKPPRPRREHPSLTKPPSQCLAPSRMFPSANFDSTGAQGHHYTHAQQPSRHVMFAGVDQFRAQQSVANVPMPIMDAFEFTSDSASPANDARSSLDILNHLCEQSRWTWVEGMLILGCLQYAVEQYADALQCFSRITAIDPRY